VTSGGVPTVALLLMTIPSIIVAALYAYTPTVDEYGVTVVKLFTLDATFGIIIMFLFSGLAFMVMKWRARGIWENSALPKSGLGGIPWMAIIAAIYCAFLVFNIFMYIWDPDGVYYINLWESAVFMGALYLAGVVIWIVAWLVRKKQGMELEAVAKEIPVE
jgi:hypothetical protein